MARRLSDAIPRAVIDSNVIFSRVLHELLGRVGASLRLLDLIWSEELLAESERVLLEEKPLTAAAATRWVGYLRESFPEGRIDLTILDPSLELTSLSADPADRHVCALAIAGSASYLFTFDRGYLRDALAAHGVEVASPDAFLAQAIDEEPTGFEALIEEQARHWAGGQPVDELLAAFERANVPIFTGKARQLLGS